MQYPFRACNRHRICIFGIQKIKYVVIARNIVEPVSKVIFSLIAIFMGYRLIGLTFVYVFSVLAATLLMVYFLKKIISFRKIALAPPIFIRNCYISRFH